MNKSETIKNFHHQSKIEQEKLVPQLDEGNTEKTEEGRGEKE